MALLSLPTTVFIANTLFLDLSKYQKRDDSVVSRHGEAIEQPAMDKEKKVNSPPVKFPLTKGKISSLIKEQQEVLRTQEYVSPIVQNMPAEVPTGNLVVVPRETVMVAQSNYYLVMDRYNDVLKDRYSNGLTDR